MTSGTPSTVLKITSAKLPFLTVLCTSVAEFTAMSTSSLSLPLSVNAALGFSTMTLSATVFSILNPLTYATFGSTDILNLSWPNWVAAASVLASPSALICAIVLKPLLPSLFKYSYTLIWNGSTL